MSSEQRSSALTLNVLFDSTEAEIVSTLSDRRWYSMTELAQLTNHPTSTIHMVLLKLERHNIIHRGESGGVVEVQIRADALEYTIGELIRGVSR